MEYEFGKKLDKKITSIVKYMFDDMGETFPFNKVRVNKYDDDFVYCTIQKKEYMFPLFEFDEDDFSGVNMKIIALGWPFMEDYAKYLGDKKLIYGYDYDDKTFLKFDLNEKGPTSKYFLTLLENKLLGI